MAIDARTLPTLGSSGPTGVALRTICGFWLLTSCVGPAPTLEQLRQARTSASQEGTTELVNALTARLCDRGDLLACIAVREAVSVGQRAALDDRICALGDGATCWSVGVARAWTEGDIDAALPAWKLGCKANGTQSCLAAGDGLRAKLDAVAALEQYGFACELGDQAGCESHRMTQQRLDAEIFCKEKGQLDCIVACDPLGAGGPSCDRALELQRGSCAHGDAQACTWAGRALSLGWVRPVDVVAGQDLLWRGCDLDDAWGCLQLVENIEAGIGGNPSPKDLPWLRNQVCDLQLDYGCSERWLVTP